MKKHIPNIITLGNLTCGLMAIMYAFSSTPWIGAYFIFGGLFLDFFDGFFARILKVDGEIGKQLDSLADLVTFGVAPGMLMFKTIYLYFEYLYRTTEPCSSDGVKVMMDYLPFLALTIPLLSAVRLAKFNVSTNQSDQFIGLPTPANAIFFAAGVIVFHYLGGFIEPIKSGEIYVWEKELKEFTYSSVWINVLMFLIVPLSLLLNANLPLIALKFKSFSWKGNEVRFIFLALCLVVILTTLLISNVFVAVPIIILLYLIISIINNFTKQKNEI